MKTSYLFLANGFEEVEAIATVDVLRRSGMTVHTVSINPTVEVTGAHGVVVKADMLIGDVTLTDDTDWLICPGGMPGATNLADCQPLVDMLCEHNIKDGRIAAICASPAVILEPLGILDSRRATCYPGMEPVGGKAMMTGNPVERDANIITGNGPANTLAFALAIAAVSQGQPKADEVATGMLLK